MATESKIFYTRGLCLFTTLPTSTDTFGHLISSLILFVQRTNWTIVVSFGVNNPLERWRKGRRRKEKEKEKEGEEEEAEKRISKRERRRTRR